MKKLKSRLGVTMAEMLIVVGIIAILGGVSFVAVWTYQRSLGQLERDGLAKEIFVAAQNHLTAVYGEGYLGISDFGTPAVDAGAVAEDSGKDIYICLSSSGFAETSILGQMLPFGAIDETIRAGGSYLIRYQKKTGLVLDVFYCSKNASPNQFNHTLAITEYATVMGLRDVDGANHKEDRKTFAAGGNSILGWYGGEAAAELPSLELQPPTIKIVNAEKLYVEVTNPNGGKEGASLKLIITGKDSKAQKSYELKFARSEMDRIHCSDNSFFTVILDDVTAQDMHFANIVSETEKSFIPGENIEIQAVAFSNSALANVAYSVKGTTNSLFGSINGGQTTAYIGNIRHLENLDRKISNLDANDSSDQLNIGAAEQTDSFSWSEFRETVAESESEAASVRVYPYEGTETGEGFYMPIEPDYALTYDGKSHSISDVAALDDHAGLFGEVSTVTVIRNLELIDFSVTGTAKAGALAGKLSGTTVTNVIARNTDNTKALAKKITAPVAGGLVGDLSGTAVYSAAAVIVSGSGSNSVAGGLIGTASGTISGSYSGGHTKKGSYSEWTKDHTCDVTGDTAGGLVGTYLGTDSITNSYSTCSVSGATAGGFIGTASGGSVTGNYATGLVEGTTKYAFLAGGTPTMTGNFYFRVINELADTNGGKTPMLPFSGYTTESDQAKIKPFDLNAAAYDSFVGDPDGWSAARAYDSALVQYYNGQYNLKSVKRLDTEGPDDYDSWDDLFVGTHYGDWPSPEVFVINP